MLSNVCTSIRRPGVSISRSASTVSHRSSLLNSNKESLTRMLQPAAIELPSNGWTTNSAGADLDIHLVVDN